MSYSLVLAQQIKKIIFCTCKYKYPIKWRSTISQKQNVEHKLGHLPIHSFGQISGDLYYSREPDECTISATRDSVAGFMFIAAPFKRTHVFVINTRTLLCEELILFLDSDEVHIKPLRIEHNG